MGDKLVIVESPAKAKTIQKYLGKGFKVTASMGHVRDLPKNGLAIDLEHDFAPAYEVTKEKIVSELRRAARQADAVYLATDPDREGEAIAWHITQAVGIPRTTPTHRVVFQEITPTAVKAAIANPRQINADLVHAQQARRVLDRLVGYQLSPLLWDKVKRGLSAGRVQSVAVRLIVEREEQVEAFKPIEYWTIEVDLQKLADTVAQGKANPVFRAVLIEQAGQKLDKFALGNQEAAQAIVTDLAHASYTVKQIARRDKKRSPLPPFTTSTLQQEAGRKLGFSARKTMTLAQQLYEGIDIGGSEGTVGLITYMRTDSTNIAQEAQQEARAVISERYGSDYLPDKPPIYKTKARGAQEAHEAIRPTSSQRHPDQLAQVLERDLLRLYDLIWRRFLASQMAPAIFDSTTVDIAATRPHDAAGTIPYLFRATGSVVKFAGFLAVYNEGLDEGEEDEHSERRLPLLREAEQLNLIALLPIQHFTEPPPRYTEASLVKDLERLGIGRPSTYAPIISTIQERGYVELVEKKLIPTTLGRVVTRLLVEHFPEIIGYEFTSTLEQKLDDIALGEARWVPVLHEFYAPFSTLLEQARHTMRNVKQDEILTGITCPKCQQGELAVKFGRNGEFLSCTRYDRKGGEDSCDFTSNFHRTAEGQIVLDANSSPALSDVMCNVCGRPMVQKKGRFGTFLGCSGYPECTNTRRLGKDGKPVPLPEPTGITCPKCHEGELLKRRGRFGRTFFSCSRYPACDYAAATREEVERAIADPATIPVTTPKPSSTTAVTPTTQTPAKRTATKRSSNGTTAITSTAATPVKSGSSTAAKKPRVRSKKKTQE